MRWSLEAHFTETAQGEPLGFGPIVFWDHELGTEENLAAVDRVAGSSESAGIVALSFADWLRSLG